MRRIKSRLIMYLVLFYVVILGGLFGFIVYYGLNANQLYNETYVTRNQQFLSNNLNNSINKKRLLINKNNNDGIINDSDINFNNANYEVINNIALGNGSIFLINDGYFKVFTLENILEEAIPYTDAQKIVLMTTDGMIYFGANYDTNLNAFLDGNTSDYMRNYFSKNLKGVIKDSLQGEAVYLAFIPLEDYRHLYFIEVYYENNLNADFLAGQIGLIIGVVVFALFVILIQIIIFNSIHKVNAEVESKKFKFYYAKPYIIKINRNGKIIKYNEMLLNKITMDEPYKNVMELELVVKTVDIMDLIRQESGFEVKFANEIVRFLTVKSNHGYFLVGEPVASVLVKNKTGENPLVNGQDEKKEETEGD